MTKIEFELFGLDLLEPLGFALNWVFGFQAWYYFKKLKNWRDSSFSVNWRWFFLFFGFSGFFGGLSHLLFNYTGLMGKIPGWSSAILAVSFLELGMCALANDYWRKKLHGLVYLKLAVTIFVMVVFFKFQMVIIHSAGMVVFILIPGFYLLLKGNKLLNQFLLGVLFIALTLPFRIFNYDPHLWFNRDDVAHVFMMITLYLFYSGVKKVVLIKRAENG